MTSKPTPLLLLFLGAATFFEGFDFIALTQVLPQVRTTWGLSSAEEGWLLGFCNIGPVLSFFLIRQADRVGRRQVLNWTLTGYAISGLVTAFAPNALVFGLAQLVGRSFLIAEWAVCMVYAAEVYPAESRGRAIGVLQALTSVGAVVCAGITPMLLHSPFGWRTVYMVGAVPLGILVIVRRVLPESPRFVAGQQRPLMELIRGPFRKRILQVGMLWFFGYLGTNIGLSFWKEYALSEAHFSDAEVGRSLTIASIIAMPLVFFVGQLMDRWGRRGAAMVIFPFGALGVFGAYTAVDPIFLTISITLLVFGCSAMLPVLEAFTAELFPTEYRGDAFGWANNLIGRQANVFIPPLIGILAGYIGWGAAVRYTSLGLFVALIGILVWMPETNGKELEETAKLT